MDPNNESAVADTDDFDLTAELAAEFDKAESGEAGNPVSEESPAETEAETAERVRDEKGRFAAKTEDAAPKQVKDASEAPKAASPSPDAAATPIEQAAVPVTDTRAPPGWSPTAKAYFAELPPDHPFRQAVAQREVEIDKGFSKLAEYKPIERFAEMARQSGTTLDRALENYVSIENELRRDFLGGIAQICRRQGVDPVSLANVILARNGAPSSQPDGTGPQPSHQTAPVDAEAIARRVRDELRAEQEAEAVAKSIKEFGSDPKNTFFENVRSDMGRLIQAGYVESIQDAYDRACWANPEIRSLLIKQQSAPSDASAKAAAASQARAASKSITGSPVPGASRGGPEPSIEDEIRELMNATV